MLIQAKDGKFYKNPVFTGEDWIVRMTEVDGNKIALKFSKRMTNDSVRKRMRQRLKATGISGSLDDYPLDIGKELIKESLEDVVVSEFEITAPIPIPSEHDGCTSLPPRFSTYIAWEMIFPTEDIWKIGKGEFSPLIMKFLCGEFLDQYRTEAEKIVLRKVRKQVGAVLKEETVELAKEKYGPGIKLVVKGGSRKCQSSF